jgi:hypothetical protein
MAPTATERKFAILDSVKMTKDEKAIVERAVTRYCLMIQKEVDWGAALATICIQWEGKMGDALPVQRPPEPKPEPAPKVVKEKKAKEVVAQPASSEGEEYEREFKIKRVAGTMIGDQGVNVIRPEEGNAAYYATTDSIVKQAKEAKEAGKSVIVGLVMREKNLWITSLEVIK